MRGIAVLVVMVLHFVVMRPLNAVEETVVHVVGLGWAGVDLFFVLSGFLITGILIDSREGEGYFRKFYARRALRIFPLYYAFLVVILWVWPAVTAAPPEPLASKVWMLTYLGNFLFAFGGWEAVPGHTTHLWSLAIEEQFYFVWPLIVFYASRRTLVRICVSAIVLAWGARLVFHLALGHGIAGYALLPARMDALALGGLLAVLVRSPGWAERLRPWLPRLAAIAATLLVATWVASPLLTPGEGRFPPLALHVQLLGFPAIDLLSFALVAYAVLPEGGPSSGLLQNAVLRSFGKYSYALYLMHIPLRNLVVNRLYPGGDLPTLWGSQLPFQGALLVGAILLTYALAFLSWHLFEKHFLGLKRFFEWQRPGPPREAPATAAALP